MDGESRNDYTEHIVIKSRRNIAVLSIGILLLVAGATWFGVGMMDNSMTTGESAASSTLRRLTVGELSRFDGSSTTLPIYIGLDGFIYDVSAGRTFYAPGAVYHYLAGSDASRSLHIMGADIIKQKYPIIGIIEK